jgi:NAD(P)-dependent dehydrogenase (short-subunit alcohol dehydrogenase family)
MDSLRLDGKVALVTGGGSGIGEGAARAFAQAGAAVAVVDLRPEPAEAVAQAIRAEGGRAMAVRADVSQEDQIAAAVVQTVREFGGLHVVFANAGINGMQTPIEEMTLDEWHQTIETNLTGTFLTVKHAIPPLRQAGGGSIIITASVNGNTIWSLPGYSAYSTSKAGQSAFAKMAAGELARWGIRVNSILPGGVATNIRERTYRRNLEAVTYEVQLPRPFPPLTGRPATPAEIAELVLFLASDASRYVTGGAFLIDGGASLLRA